MQRGSSPWKPEIPTEQQDPPPRRRRNRTTPVLVGALTVLIAVVAAVVVFGMNQHRVEAGSPIPVARSVIPTTTTTTPDNPGQPATTTEPATTTAPPTSLGQGQVPDGYMGENGPAGIQVSIPAGWTITDPFAAEDEADDPAGSGSLIRYGGTPSSAMSLLAAVTSDETGNTSVKTDYQQIQLDQVDSPTGDDTVVWEFLFDKNGVQRHVLSWFWRANGTDYVLYFSATAANWATMQPIVTAVEQTAGPT